MRLRRGPTGIPAGLRQRCAQPENIRRQLGELESSIALEVRDSVDSTNTLVKHLAEQGGREGMVVIAQHQTAGKGRLGRSFYSPKNTQKEARGCISASCCGPKFSAQEALSITTAAAVAVAKRWTKSPGKRGERPRSSGSTTCTTGTARSAAS